MKICQYCGHYNNKQCSLKRIKKEPYDTCEQYARKKRIVKKIWEI